MKFSTRLFFTSALLLLPLAAAAQIDLFVGEGGDGVAAPTGDDAKMVLPRWGITTNLLDDATGSVSLGAEFRVGVRTSMNVSGSWNPWIFGDNRQWRHILVRPEFRWWLGETFDGHFLGAGAGWAFFNVGNLPSKPFSQYMKDHRFQGRAVSVGASYGYRWNFSHRWGLEATLGVGYAYLDYDKFPCAHCGEKISSGSKNYFGPTKLGLNLIYGIGGKGGAKKSRGFNTTIYAPTFAPVYVPREEEKPVEPRFGTSFIVPEVEEVKSRSESGSAYLDFEQGRWMILPDFRNNAAELQKIRRTIVSVSGDPDATITGITIMGYASPEGGSENNRRLSERRAQALGDYVVSHHDLPSGMVSVSGMGEDWPGLEEMVKASDMEERDAVLDVIGNGYQSDDVIENRLRSLAGGGPWRKMYIGMFPALRRSDYSIDYTVVPFTVEKGREVLRTRPGNLSLNEMFLIANTYATGSDEWGEVFEIAARVFPDSDVANVNAAAVALENGNAASAAGYLARVKSHSPEYWNNMGILSWMRGERTEAAECFARGGARGRANAEEIK